ncbi:hypothetical protein L873DRAFT_1115304 [Choiromyces venosus 120613-1]|uniref:Uncharacterized protein n=1 Tax=Choiromyces venosus 120613-1 TaxID=1336337 RepID=A0A3N4JKT7_9PEZI|nr:hypothetical protein L873DRAFT_1115304 [Choiromyces venosus 120613-1]
MTVAKILAYFICNHSLMDRGRCLATAAWIRSLDSTLLPLNLSEMSIFLLKLFVVAYLQGIDLMVGLAQLPIGIVIQSRRAPKQISDCEWLCLATKGTH